MSSYKGIEVPNKLDGIIDHMSVLETAREELAILGQQWDLLTILGQMSGSGTDMSGTRKAFQDLTSDLLSALGIENLKKTVSSMTSKAQVSVDIVIRNLFERTADIGFLATDEDIRAFLRNNSGGRSLNLNDVKRLRKRFSEYVAKYSVYNNIILLDKDGEVLCQLDESNDITRSEDPIIVEALTTNDDFVETYRETDLCNSGKKSLIYSYRVTETNGASSKSLGVLCLVFDFEEEMEGVFNHLLNDEDWVVLSLLNEGGEVIASSDEYQIPVGASVPTVKDEEFKITKFGGRLYLSKTCVTKGYQDFYGLGWQGQAMIPIEYAFNDSGNKNSETVPDKIMDVIMENAGLFAKELREISENAEQIQSELDQTVWNGNLIKDVDESETSSMAKKVLLWEVSTTGSKTKNVFERSIHSLHQTVVTTILSDAEFSASLAIDIMDRNLYERANDCRWWALTTEFRAQLAQQTLSQNCVNKIQEILVYINGLYTVYTNLFIYDTKGKVIAVSNPSEKHIIGKVLSDDYIQQTLAIRNTQVYSVSPFKATELYGDKHTYIYGAAITDIENPLRAVGGIGIVFDSTPEFNAMLDDALPKDHNGMPPEGCFGVLTERDGRVISSTDETLSSGSTLKIDRNLLLIKNGDTTKSIVDYHGQYYAVGVAASNGYREYKSQTDSYHNEVLAFTFIPLGQSNVKPCYSSLKHHPIHVSHNIREPGVNYTEFATFYIANSWLGVNTKYVEEALNVSKITGIPSPKSGLEGSIMYRDKPIAILNPNTAFAQDKKRSRTSQVLVLKTEAGQVGIIIDGLGEIPEIEEHRLVRGNFFEEENQKYIDAIIKPSDKDEDDRILIIIDPSSFIDAILNTDDALEAFEKIYNMGITDSDDMGSSTGKRLAS